MGNKGIEIVIADGDSTQIAKQIATYASKDEMRVVDMVSTGDEAVESIKLYKPDIVILDICLSGMDGLGVMEHMSECLSIRIRYLWYSHRCHHRDL